MAKRHKKDNAKSVSRILYKYGGKRFNTKVKSNQASKELLDKLRAEGKRVNIKNVLDSIRKKRIPKIVYTIPESLKRIRQYFEMEDLPTIIHKEVAKGIKIKSNLIPYNQQDPYLEGGFYYEYGEYFAPFVNFMDKQRSNALSQGGVDPYDIFCVTCSEPDKDGFCELYSCDQNGDKQDYGFDNKNIDADPTRPITQEEIDAARKAKGLKQKKEQPPTTSGETNKDIELEKEREKTKQVQAEADIKRSELKAKALEAFLQGKITEAQFNAIIS